MTDVKQRNAEIRKLLHATKLPDELLRALAPTIATIEALNPEQRCVALAVVCAVHGFYSDAANLLTRATYHQDSRAAAEDVVAAEAAMKAGE